MPRVEIMPSLAKQIFKRFPLSEVKRIRSLIGSLEQNPKKGKLLSAVGGIIIKELKHKAFRFYFVTDGHVLRTMDAEKLENLLIRFVRMSDKNSQQGVIDDIKDVLRKIGPAGFH